MCIARILALVCSFALVSLRADDSVISKPEAEVIILEDAPAADASEEEKASYWERVRQQYEAAKDKSMELVDKTKDATGDYYNKAKDATGEAYHKAAQATGDAYEKTRDTTVGWYQGAKDWTKEDLQKAGDWYYRVVVIDQDDIREDPTKIETMFNELGSERFECFWVEPLDTRNKRIAFFFKKSGVSYLKSIPSKEFWRLLPRGDDDAASQ